MYAGLELTASERKPSGIAILDGTGCVRSVRRLATDEEIIECLHQSETQLVGIDSPLFLPSGWHCLDWPCLEGVCPDPGQTRRVAERDLHALGIRFYWTTKRSFIKPLIRRAMGLRARFAVIGLGAIETYPYAGKVRLFGHPIARKTARYGRDWLRERLNRCIPGLKEQGSLTHTTNWTRWWRRTRPISTVKGERRKLAMRRKE